MRKSDYEKPDFWSQKAFKEGYPARSVYKLQEIDEKFHLLPRAGNNASFRVLDLGAAPGSWSRYVLRTCAAQAGFLLVSCDLAPLSPAFARETTQNSAFSFLQGDMLAPENRCLILAKGPYNLALSDAAPATSGNRGLDTARSTELARAALTYAQDGLAAGGAFVVKIFQGSETTAFLAEARVLFDTLKTFKPRACRTSSFETYIVGIGKHGH